MDTAEVIVPALVQSWNARRVRVQCPYCWQFHQHDFRGGYRDTRHRAPCMKYFEGRTCFYDLRYPFTEESDIPAYEIDKVTGHFAALSDKTLQGSLEDSFAALSIDADPNPAEYLKWQDADEQASIRYELECLNGSPGDAIKNIEIVAKRMCNGDIEAVWDFLRTSPYIEHFIYGADISGNRALCLAARSPCTEAVRVLLKWGANVNCRNWHGRTPLMEAALWGRADTVSLLLEANDNRDLKDRHGLKAIDLAQDSERNEIERYIRAEVKKQVTREITYQAKRDRASIAEKLRDSPGESLAKSGHVLKAYRFDKMVCVDTRGGTIRFTKSITTTVSVENYLGVAPWNVTGSWKTIARLERREGYPSVSAKSGWTEPGSATMLPSYTWTAKAMNLAHTLGYPLKSSDKYDQGIPGRYLACHAERQLIAYFVSLHVLLPQEMLSAPVGDEETRIRDLALAIPPVMLISANILTSTPPCAECIHFCDSINEALNLNIILQDCSQRAYNQQPLTPPQSPPRA